MKKNTIKEEGMKEFLRFENELLSNPKTFFSTFEQSFKGRQKIIWKEFIDWQNCGGKIKNKGIRIIGDDKNILTWNFGEEHYAQQIDKFAPFSIEEYKNALNTIFSFMEDRPQYYKFRKLGGMFNPLRLLIYELI